MALRPPLRAELLEDRATPAAFGVPWQNPTGLTVSFAPDGTPIAGHASDLFAALDAQMPRDQWQATVLRAYQTWAAHANVDVRVVPDGGQPFGAPGFSQGDPRFGDVRVGAQRMSSSVLAVAAPPDPTVSGTWAGDLLLNSRYPFGGGGYDLYSVLLHEAGHTLGLGNTADPTSVMYSGYNAGLTALAPADVAAVQALYGRRAGDPHEGQTGNGTTATASPVPVPDGYEGDTPLVAFGDIAPAGDADVYAFELPDAEGGAGYLGDVTVRLQTRGVSLLAARVTVYDEAGNVLGSTLSTDPRGDVLTVRLNGAAAGAGGGGGEEDGDEGGDGEDEGGESARFFVRVESATDDVFGVGGYALAVGFDGLSATAEEDLERVLVGGHRGLDANAVRALLRDPAALLNPDGRSNETASNPTVLAPTAGRVPNSNFQAVGSVEAAGDVDVYRIRTARPETGRDVLTVTAWSPGGLTPRLSLIDGSGKPVTAARVLVSGNGTATLQLDGAVMDGDYYVRVDAAPGSPAVGSYFLMADVHATPAAVETFAAGEFAGADRADAADLYVARSHLFHFVLEADGPTAPPGTTVRMTITDAAGAVVFDLAVGPGEVASASVFLRPGAYAVRFEATAPDGAALPPVGYRLRGSKVTDPTGPALDDPTLTPTYVDPASPTQYSYPTGDVTTLAYLWFALVL